MPAGRDTLETTSTNPRQKTSMGFCDEFAANSKDENFDWFQQDHDFKIVTRAQLKKFESQKQGMRMLKPKPKLNLTGPVISDT